ncbi:MAG: DsbA family protein [Methanoregulaceae archaeon]
MNADRSRSPRDPLHFIAILIGIVAIITLLLICSGTVSFRSPEVSSPGECAANAVSYVNENLLPPGASVNLTSVKESHGLYEIVVRYNEKNATIYSTHDCRFLFTSGVINMSAPVTGKAVQKAAAKTERPVADLYVMSYCPYGTRAEEILKPVTDLLGNKADIRVRYLTKVNGENLSSVESLHGTPEANEDAFQICVREANASAFWPYLHAFDTGCYMKIRSSSDPAACSLELLPSLGISNETLRKCLSGKAVIQILKDDEAAATIAGAEGSPTLVINNVTYTGTRSPEGYKQAICDSFITKPDECSTVLSTNTTSASGNC